MLYRIKLWNNPPISVWLKYCLIPILFQKWLHRRLVNVRFTTPSATVACNFHFEVPPDLDASFITIITMYRTEGGF